MENSFRSVATKISVESYITLMNICKKKTLTVYDFMQMVVDVIIRYCDDMHQLNPSMQTLINAFEGLVGWKDAFSLSDPTSKPMISEATYYLNDEDGKKHGVRGVLVKYPYFGKAQFTYNIQLIAERMFCLIFPRLYKRLRMAAVSLDTNSVIETIDKLLSDYETSDDDRTLSEIFSDCRRSDAGRTMKEGGPYKRTHNRDMDTPGLFDSPEQ